MAKAAGDAVRGGDIVIHPRAWSRAGSPGSTICTTGASRGSCGGDTGFRSGMAPTVRPSASAPTRPRRRAGNRTPTFWTPGSHRRCGRSPPWGGRTARPISESFIHQRSRHRLRHPVLLGARMVMFGTFVADDAAITCGVTGPAGAVRERLPTRPYPRRARPQDEQVPRQRHRSAGLVELFGADALRFTLARGQARRGSVHRRGPRPRLA